MSPEDRLQEALYKLDSIGDCCMRGGAVQWALADMTPEQRRQFGPITFRLNDGRGVIIRPLAAGDADALAVFYESVPREDFRFYAPHLLDTEHAIANAARSDSPDEVVLVLTPPRGQAVVGEAWVRRRNGGPPVFGICLAEEYQSAGAGGAITARVLAIVDAVDPGTVVSLTVQQANTRAVKLYTRMGFRIVREQIHKHPWGFDPEPEYCMERTCPVHQES